MAEIPVPTEDALGSTLAHSRSVAEVLAVLGSSGEGLDNDTARERLAAYGANKLPTKGSRPAVLRFFAHFNDVLIYILIAAGVLKAILGEWVDFAVIISVAVINALVGRHCAIHPGFSDRRIGQMDATQDQQLITSVFVRLIEEGLSCALRATRISALS